MSEKTLDCGHAPTQSGGVGTGYGTFGDKTYCYPCCADLERQHMRNEGRAVLYMPDTSRTNVPREISNWTGYLRFPVLAHSVGMASAFGKLVPRVDAWFIGPDGAIWHARHQGEWNDVAHCRRTKKVSIYAPRERKTYYATAGQGGGQEVP